MGLLKIKVDIIFFVIDINFWRIVLFFKVHQSLLDTAISSYNTYREVAERIEFHILANFAVTDLATDNLYTSVSAFGVVWKN